MPQKVFRQFHGFFGSLEKFQRISRLGSFLDFTGISSSDLVNNDLGDEAMELGSVFLPPLTGQLLVGRDNKKTTAYGGGFLFPRLNLALQPLFSISWPFDKQAPLKLLPRVRTWMKFAPRLKWAMPGLNSILG